jgi:uncharacterized protein with FMN-binding domain
MKPAIKKYILSTVVAASFIVYALFQRSANWLNNQSSGGINGQGSQTGAGGLTAHLPVDQPAKTPLVVTPAPPPPQRPAAASKTNANGQAYKDGIFTGASADAYYGPVQVKITVQAGKITNAVAINYPKENQTSVLINQQALPILKSEAIAAQSAKIDVVSGATYTSFGYATSLNSALAKATNPAVAKISAKPATGTALTPPPAPAPVPPPTAIPPATPAPATPAPVAGAFKNGQYTGDLVNVYYGNVQVQATIQGGRLADVQFLTYPQDRQTSVFINSQATPILRQEALTAQSAQVNVVSGATYTSTGFIQSLASALSQAAIQPQGGATVQPPTPTPLPVQLPRRRYEDD